MASPLIASPLSALSAAGQICVGTSAGGIMVFNYTGGKFRLAVRRISGGPMLLSGPVAFFSAERVEAAAGKCS